MNYHGPGRQVVQTFMQTLVHIVKVGLLCSFMGSINFVGDAHDLPSFLNTSPLCESMWPEVIDFDGQFASEDNTKRPLMEQKLLRDIFWCLEVNSQWPKWQVLLGLVQLVLRAADVGLILEIVWLADPRKYHPFLQFFVHPGVTVESEVFDLDWHLGLEHEAKGLVLHVIGHAIEINEHAFGFWFFLFHHHWSWRWRRWRWWRCDFNHWGWRWLNNFPRFNWNWHWNWLRLFLGFRLHAQIDQDAANAEDQKDEQPPREG
mmetsp:Transcript_145569/g.264980  ORF Transcript_145569/g.264980 Transcript_145569/m.264980 type:complete len:260 (+) Transcript_145569:360-1139(+)